MAGAPWCVLPRIEAHSRHFNLIAHARHSRLEYPSRAYQLCAFEAGLILCRRLKDLRASGEPRGGGGGHCVYCMDIPPGPALPYLRRAAVHTHLNCVVDAAGGDDREVRVALCSAAAAPADERPHVASQ
jgi:hypothetical protein